MKTHKDLEVWKKSIEFVVIIYNITSTFPKGELYGLTSQIRRSAVSIPSNIAEGAARNHENEFCQFLYIALASSAELETQLIISQRLDFIQREKSQELIDELNSIARMLQGLIKSIKTH
jgi:four helix bundle protein